MGGQIIRRRIARTVAVSALLAIGAIGTQGVAEAYPPPPPDSDERALDVSAFSPFCMKDAPFIQYSIVPIGFVPDGPATLTFTDVNGNVVDTIVVNELSGQVIYPGASVDADGNATDWPGWTNVDGSWVPDDSDAILRRGLSITVDVGLTAVANVSYPPEAAACAGPRTVGSGTPGTLPQTGGPDTGLILLIAGVALASGVAITTTATRRRSHASA